MAEQVDEAEARLAEIVEVVVAISTNDFTRRASVGDGLHLLDGLAAGVNMLAEEVGLQMERERAYHRGILRTERLAALGQLAAGVAHEINNPAAYVLANLASLERLLVSAAATAPPELAAALQQAVECTRDNVVGVERIVAIARDLRGFARPDVSAFEVLDVGRVIEDACKLVRAEVAYRARFVVGRATGLRVRGDRTKLVQVLTNLLLNAAQAIPEGAPERNEVEVSAGERAGRVVVSVRDTGTGVPVDVRARIFEPFFTTKARDRGTGLGLAISADIVRQHGGELRLVSTSEAGTVFEVVLAREADAEPTRAAAAAEPVHRAARVLLVDDEERLLVALRRLLKGQYEVTTACGGRAAIEAIERDDRWDVILCDLVMPELDGVAVYEWVHAHRPALGERMLFCSGGLFTPRGFAFAEQVGEARILQKPVAPGRIREAIERTLTTLGPGAAVTCGR